MDNVSVQFKRSEPDDDGEVSPWIEMTLSCASESAGLSASITLGEVSERNCRKLVDAIANNTDYKLLCCLCNGEVSAVVAENGYTIFTVTKCGAGGDGDITVTIKNEHCAKEFEAALAALK